LIIWFDEFIRQFRSVKSEQGHRGRRSSPRGHSRGASETSQKSIVLSVCTNPEPDDKLSLDDRESTIAEPNTGRIDWPGSVDLPELQAWMTRIVAEASVRLTHAPPDLVRQIGIRATEALGGPRRQRASGSSALVRPARCSPSASSARCAKASCD